MAMHVEFPILGVYDDGQLIRMKTAKKAVVQYLEYTQLFGSTPVSVDDIYIVWFCKTLQNWKALLSTDLVDYGIYFEATYNGNNHELYLDHYKKVMNVKMSVYKEGS